VDRARRPAPDAHLERGRRDKPKPVAYFLVDAMRFEMGVELAERLPKTSEVAVRAAVGALPSITPIGMAALHARCLASFSVVEEKDKLGARIDDASCPTSRPGRSTRRRACRSWSTSRSTSC
jgi:hypothetical protein